MTLKTTRALSKRELERAIGNLEWVEQHLMFVYAQTTEGHHDELRDQLLACGMVLEELKNAITRINERM